MIINLPEHQTYLYPNNRPCLESVPQYTQYEHKARKVTTLEGTTTQPTHVTKLRRV